MTDEQVREALESPEGAVDPSHQLAPPPAAGPRLLPPTKQMRTEQWKETARRYAGSASSAWNRVRERALDGAEEYRWTVANAMDNVAFRIHDQAEALGAGREAAHGAHRAANKLQSAAGYLRTHEAREMAGAAREFTVERPGVMLIAAAAVGFLTGRAVRGLFSRRVHA